MLEGYLVLKGLTESVSVGQILFLSLCRCERQRRVSSEADAQNSDEGYGNNSESSFVHV